jgi:pyruvate/2-oxoacid:ferredoxin oxidoreductase alpha subunit
MTLRLLTGNQAAARVLIAAGEANRHGRGCGGGVYPITPQTEISEQLTAHSFSKGSYVTVESEHSAMAVCIGASLAGARSFTASSSNGLLYMTENVFAAGLCRLPIVLVVSNRSVGPPWNLWVDQGDSLAMRDAAWMQFYCEAHQDLADTILLAFRVAEDPRVLLPAMVAQDGFLVSHTLMEADLPGQELVDAYLPGLDLPQRLRSHRAILYGNMMTPLATADHRREVEDAMDCAQSVLDEALDEFESVFGRRPAGPLTAEMCEDADTILVATGTMTRTARAVVSARRARGDKVGLVILKLFRPFPRAALRAAVAGARRVGVLDRNLSAGSGGIFWGEVATSLQRQPDVAVQGYLMGLGGTDVTASDVDRIVDDLRRRERFDRPVFASEVTA